MCPHVCGGQEVRGHTGGLSCSPSYIETVSLADSDRLAGQGGLPSALTTDALVWAFFFFKLGFWNPGPHPFTRHQSANLSHSALILKTLLVGFLLIK